MPWGQGGLEEVMKVQRAHLAGIASAPARAAAEGARDVAQIQAASESARTAAQTSFYDKILAQQQQAGGGLTGMINQYNQAFQAAKAANEAKYQEALGVVGTTTGQQRTDVLKQYQGQRANVMQSLARLGMSGTTIAPTMQAGIQREQQSALNRISDQMMQAKLGVMQGFEHKYPEPGITQAAIQAMAPNYQYPSF